MKLEELEALKYEMSVQLLALAVYMRRAIIVVDFGRNPRVKYCRVGWSMKCATPMRFINERHYHVNSHMNPSLQLKLHKPSLKKGWSQEQVRGHMTQVIKTPGILLKLE